jgi:hypothetical protein
VNSTNRKGTFLGMPWGTANHRLRKMVLFSILEKHGENICYRCNKVIETKEELSLEHKVAWENTSVELFWDLNNIAWSHLKCNIQTRFQNKADERRCKRGHFLTMENVYIDPKRKNRHCRMCKRIRDKNRKKRD